MNLEAENMIDRFVWRSIVPGPVIIALLCMVAFVFWFASPRDLLDCARGKICEEDFD
ncbi:MAG: hypothetical protein ACRD9S_15075 [Pyrinomonadaceae bacterium]